MAEIWVAGATLLVGAWGANQGAKAGERGAQAQQDAAAAATAEERRQFDLIRQDQAPWLEAGQGALRRQEQFLSGDWSGFENSPDYKWAVQQGTQALDRGAAARGGLFGGGADADRISLGQGLATQYANNYWNKLAAQAGMGQSTAQGLGQLGMGMAGNIGQNAMNAANARASSYANTANQWSNFGQQAVGALGQWYGQRGAANQPSYGAGSMNGFGNNPNWGAGIAGNGGY